MFHSLKIRNPAAASSGSSPEATQTSGEVKTNRTRLHRIVIVGGGAGGLELATQLGNKSRHDHGFKVILADRLETHLWKPLLHEVAAGSIDANANQLEYAAQARWHYFEFQQGELVGLDRSKKTLTLAQVNDEEGVEILPIRNIEYDTLVLAIGSTSNFFNTPGAAEHANAVDTVKQAEKFRQRLISACIRSRSHLPDAAQQPRPQVNIVIIGAGATGVELSAELRNTAQILGAYGLHHLDPQRDIHITLLEAGPRILGSLPEHVAEETARMLEQLNVTILTGEKVTAVQEHAVLTASGKTLPADLTVWAAGIQIAGILGKLGLPVNKLGQVIVTQTLQTGVDPDIFAFGDCASCPWPATGKTVPPRAQAAHQQAKYLYHALQRHLAGKPLAPFVYQDTGSLISLGRFNAVGNLMGKLIGRSLLVEGTLARLLYFLLYRMHLVALHGFARMLLDTVIQWLQRKAGPRVKLH
jgi:NADH:ubiquinone reductase (H+-translocating)